MKPILILGLGNRLMGDDGIGALIADLLNADPSIPPEAEVAEAGTDLLRSAGLFEGRRHVILIDASADPPAGAVSVVDRLDATPSVAAHSLSAPESVELLQSVFPALRDTRFTWVLIHVAEVRAGESLSLEVAAAIPRALEAVRGVLRPATASTIAVKVTS